jgi:hypothetical protein
VLTPSPCPSRRHGRKATSSALACRFNDQGGRQGRHGQAQGRFPSEHWGRPATSLNAPPAACRPDSGDQKGKIDWEGKRTTIAITDCQNLPAPVIRSAATRKQ